LLSHRLGGPRRPRRRRGDHQPVLRHVGPGQQGELDGQEAFTQGKVKIKGKMLKMMQLRGSLAYVQAALAAIDAEY
jgi:UDP-N-acetylglucosamine enolpyruvyl transferase